jgi:hypothetical protein
MKGLSQSGSVVGVDIGVCISGWLLKAGQRLRYACQKYVNETLSRPSRKRNVKDAGKIRPGNPKKDII